MRNVKTTITLALLISLSSVFAETKFVRYQERPIKVIEKKVVKLKPQIKVEKLVLKKNTQSFFDAIGKRESSDRWTVINKFGYYGRYQLSKENIRKFCSCTPQQYLNSKDLQNKSMHALLKHNKKVLRRQIRKYANTEVNGIYVTESGILAAAHLAGSGNVKRWFRNGRNPKDKLGTSLEDYMKLFSGYNLHL